MAVLVSAQAVTIVMSTPGVEDLEHVADVLSGWQDDGGPLHLHPGDLGWHSLRGAATTAGSLRVWSRGDRLLAIGLLDGPDGLLRMAVAPDARQDEELSRQLVADAQEMYKRMMTGPRPDLGRAIPDISGREKLVVVPVIGAGWPTRGRRSRRAPVRPP